MTPPLFSLVLCTLGREAELDSLFASLEEQEEQFELIIVDQNEHDHIREKLKNYPRIDNWKFVKSPRGLSRARNVGLRLATGSILAFPDDDSTYPPLVLEMVRDLLDSNSEIGILSGMISEKPVALASNACAQEMAPQLVPATSWFRGIHSSTIFVDRRKNKRREKWDIFDEKLGVGAAFGSSEESDFIYQLRQEGMKLYRVSGCVCYHPNKDADFDSHRAYYYGLGVGAFFRKHLSVGPVFLLMFARAFMGPILRMAEGVLRLRTDEIGYQFKALAGRYRGFNLWCKQQER